jgi:hypothetical protein
MSGLSVNDLISAQIVLSPTAAPTSNFGALLVLGSSAVIDVVERVRTYSSLTAVANDFGTSAPEYLAAQAFFGQSPQPATLLVGSWAQSATHGLLHGGALSAGQQALATFTAITNGGVTFNIDGSAVNLSTLNFSSAVSLNSVASVLTTALGAHGSCAWNPVYNRFEFVSASTGASSSFGFGAPYGAGSDVSALLGSTAASGATSVAGQASETFAAAVAACANVSNAWYGVTPAASAMPSDTDLINTATAVEAMSPRRFLFATTQEAGALSSSSTTDLAYLIQNGQFTHTACQYSSSSPYAAASLFARQASVNFNAQNSTITLMYKQEPGVAPETLTESQAAALKAKNCNVFVNYNNSTAIIQWGTVGSGQYIDTIVGCDWLQNALQVALFNALYSSTTKIPQTDAGVNVLLTTADAILAQAVDNGLIAPGVWNGPNLGAIVTGQMLSKGYYLYAPPIASQSASARAARQAPTIQAAIKLGGAIHSASILVSVSQ